MKTETKIQIIDFIEKNGPTPPKTLAKKVQITLQTLHRHLNDLMARAILERRGSPPFTTYALAGTPDFSRAFAWNQSRKPPPVSQEVSETRDVFSGRLSHLTVLEKQGLSMKELALLIAIVGEIGNNSFDHNLGQWKDVPGCWFQVEHTKLRLWVFIADRGQGIYRSLLRVNPAIANEQEAMERAFSETISGRAPEQRGNGLKFVKKVVTEQPESGLACLSGKGHIQMGECGNDCARVLQSLRNRNTGTVTLILWGRHENRT